MQDVKNVHKHHKHHTKHKALKIISAIIVTILVIAGGAFAVYYHNARSLFEASYVPSHGKKLRNSGSIIDNKQPISILLLGTDTGALGRDYKGRTDSMMVLTLNPAKQLTTITSIARDTRTNIAGYPEFSPAKINAAYAYGSAGAAMATVQNLIGNPIDFYVLINMGGLEKVIDQVGGVDVTSPLTFNFAGYSFNKGQTYHMDGNKALQFSRMRHEDPLGDYGRQNRQRLVIMALINELKKPSNLADTKLLGMFTKNVQTDLQFNQLEDLILNYRDASKHVTQDHLQGQGQMINGQSYEVVSNEEKNRVAAEIAKALQQ
ncbi:LCP family protein [Periweissella ghanensis]|uniref:Polyisoprenyl-teichoic acid--peptidoglycan teichoic acid transferase TagU n=1 Tax=Periweissella ghanensis TaxID=467997 RepID=A0ABN8BQX1_9LACO|nr:LCP family protein [Periweissella ghanensis]MCM0600243.1 LCP family protein [Periweissella ghanensis]CAH0419125.1 Polyisoprenyl-teichoic acid--peptidoglycan teichoic acid transferase TagU [Periweissella ghanensis]